MLMKSSTPPNRLHPHAAGCDPGDETGTAGPGTPLLTVDDLKVTAKDGLFGKTQPARRTAQSHRIRARPGRGGRKRPANPLGARCCSCCPRRADGWWSAAISTPPSPTSGNYGKILIVFQDPLASLTRMPVGVSIAEPLKTLEPQLSRNPARRVRHQRSASA